VLRPWNGNQGQSYTCCSSNVDAQAMALAGVLHVVGFGHLEPFYLVSGLAKPRALADQGVTAAFPWG
jgi:hypothetical protein